MSWDGSKEGVHEACNQLWLAPGLRRSWRGARAETALLEAWNLAKVEGVVLPLERMRELVVQAPGPVSVEEAQALGLWRASWSLLEQSPPVGPQPAAVPSLPAPALVGTINRDLCSHLVAGGHFPSEQVAMPQHPLRLGQVREAAGNVARDGLEVAAEVLALLAGGDVFPMASQSTGFLFAKRYLLDRGIEPTGVAVLSSWAAQNPVPYQDLVHRTQAELAEQNDGEVGPISAGLLSNWQYVLGASLIAGVGVGLEVADKAARGELMDEGELGGGS